MCVTVDRELATKWHALPPQVNSHAHTHIHGAPTRLYWTRACQRKKSYCSGVTGVVGNLHPPYTTSRIAGGAITIISGSNTESTMGYMYNMPSPKPSYTQRTPASYASLSVFFHPCHAVARPRLETSCRCVAHGRPSRATPINQFKPRPGACRSEACFVHIINTSQHAPCPNLSETSMSSWIPRKSFRLASVSLPLVVDVHTALALP